MDENKPLIEETKKSVRTREDTIWYKSEEKCPKNEVVNRLILWDDSFYEAPEETESKSWEDEPGGYIDFDIYEKTLYDKIFEYFNLQRIPSFMDEAIEIKLHKKSYVTEWSFPNGKIRCYHRWFCNKRLKDPGTSGRISFTFDDKELFEKFKAYTLKFEP